MSSLPALNTHPPPHFNLTHLMTDSAPDVISRRYEAEIPGGAAPSAAISRSSGDAAMEARAEMMVSLSLREPWR